MDHLDALGESSYIHTYEACFINFDPILIICISGLGWIINPGNEVIDKG